MVYAVNDISFHPYGTFSTAGKINHLLHSIFSLAPVLICWLSSMCARYRGGWNDQFLGQGIQDEVEEWVADY